MALQALLQLLQKASEKVGQIGGGLTSTAIGIGQKRKAKKLFKEAEALEPPLEDLEQRKFLEEVKRRQSEYERQQRMLRGYQTGSAFNSQRRALGQNTAALSAGIVRASGGNTGTLLSSLNKLNRSSAQILSDIFARGEEQQFREKTTLDNQLNYLQGSIGGLVGEIAQRKLDLQSLKQDRVLTRANTLEREGNANLMNGLANILGGGNKNTEGQ